MPRRFVVEADGGSRGNPGRAGYGALVRDADSGELLAEVADTIGPATNNVAEYSGLLAGLATAVQLDPDCTVEVRMDSRLVVEQMSGGWSIKHEDMRRLAAQARALIPTGRVTYTWIPRAQNTHADRLANEAMDGTRSGTTFLAPVLPVAGAGAGTGAGTGGTGPVPDLGRPTTLLLVRHARTASTGRDLTGGVGADALGPPLDGMGEAQAAALAVRLTAPDAELPEHLAAPSVVIASPLRRTRQTADALAAALQVRPVVERDWIEVDSLEQEALERLLARGASAVERLLQAHRGHTVAVVTHAGPVKAVLAAALQAGSAALWRLRIDPASISVVRYWADGGIEVAAVNDVAHLAHLAGGVELQGSQP